MKVSRLTWLLMAAAWLLYACAGTTPAPKLPEPLPIPGAANYMASVQVADITPPLHLSLFGHGPESRIATGVRLRLRCEVFVIAADHRAVALVPCDLNSPSLALQRAVAAQLAERGVPIGAGALFIMATHTHAGPAHYYESRRYSGALSSTAPGYDPKVVEFLAGRIASKIADAYGSLEPVCLGWRTRELNGLSFNRSFLPFLANTPEPREGRLDIVARTLQAEAELRHSVAPAGGKRGGELQRLSLSGPETAIDPQLSVLKISRLNGANNCRDAKLIGVFAVYGMHPTGVPNTNELYHGDIFGFATRAAEGRLSGARTDLDEDLSEAWRAESAPPVDEREHVIVGLANGVEGDVSPKLAPQSVVSARKHGLLLGAAIAELASIADPAPDSNAAEAANAPVAMAPKENKPQVIPSQASGTLEIALNDLRFPNAQVGKRARLCKFAELGVAAGGGAQDGPTRLRILPEANAGYRLVHPYKCHGEKLPLRTGGHNSHDFPEFAPIGLVRVAGGLIATAPGEMTTVTGQRIRFAIRDAIGKPDVLALVGLTNQYLQYFTTPEEYRLQYYEGASNLYGPNTQPFLANQFAMLAKMLGSSSTVGQIKLEPFQPDPFPEVNRWPTPSEPNEAGSLTELKLHPIVKTDSDGLALYIDELPLDFTTDRDRFSVQVLMEKQGEYVVVDDDRGSSIEVRENDGKWRIRWLPDTLPRSLPQPELINAVPPPDPRCNRRFKLAVHGRINLVSEAKELQCARR